MNLILTVLTILSAVLPLAERSLQFAQQVRRPSPIAIAPAPPEVGQANCVYHAGAWWKFENGVWLVWTNQPQPQLQLAQGGARALR